VYNEKIRGASYITVFDGVFQFLTTSIDTNNMCQQCDIIGHITILRTETRLTIYV